MIQFPENMDNYLLSYTNKLNRNYDSSHME
jgi:hypothetical protein